VLGVKQKKRPITSIMKIARFDHCLFMIQFKDTEKPFDPPKEIRYKTLNPDDCSNILAKINFLLSSQVSGLSFLTFCCVDKENSE